MKSVSAAVCVAPTSWMNPYRKLKLRQTLKTNGQAIPPEMVSLLLKMEIKLDLKMPRG